MQALPSRVYPTDKQKNVEKSIRGMLAERKRSEFLITVFPSDKIYADAKRLFTLNLSPYTKNMYGNGAMTAVKNARTVVAH